MKEPIGVQILSFYEKVHLIDRYYYRIVETRTIFYSHPHIHLANTLKSNI
jgi:hypothetical protein